MIILITLLKQSTAHCNGDIPYINDYNYDNNNHDHMIPPSPLTLVASGLHSSKKLTRSL